MSNKGHYIDRSPIICPAGKVQEAKEHVPDCLREYTIVDEIDAVKHETKTKEKTCFPYVPRRAVNTRNQGVYTESRDIFCPPITRRYETLIEDLRETTYQSFWNKTLGAVRDPTGNLPVGMDLLTTRFGIPTTKDISVKELVNPPKCPLEILLDSQEGHELYRKSHNDYNLNEHVHRGYLQPAFDPNKRYGMRTNYDPKGTWVKCACTWHLDDPITVARDIQANVAEKTKSKLGKCLTPNNNIEKVPKGFSFGKPCIRQPCGVWELLRDPDVAPCPFRRDCMMWMEHINQLRTYIHKRRGLYIDLRQLNDMFKFFDKEHTGWLPIETLYKICQSNHITFDHNKMNSLACLLGILKDGKMDYSAFTDLINVDKPFPELMKISDVPEHKNYFITTNMAAQCDYLTMDNSDMLRAGIPTVRTDLDRPAVPPGNCRADLDHLGDETTAAAVVNPSIYTNYGLNHRDFFLPKDADYQRKLFEEIGLEFPDDSFDKLWKIALHQDKTGLVCIDTFKTLLRATIPPATFTKNDESKC